MSVFRSSDLYLFIQLPPIFYLYYLLFSHGFIFYVVLLCLAIITAYVHSMLRREVLRKESLKMETQEPARLSRRISMIEKIKQALVNPFVSPTWRINEEERIRLSIMAAVLVPFRVIWILCWLLVAYVASKIGLYGFDSQNGMKPLSASKRMILMPVLKFCVRMMLAGFGFFYVTTRGTPAKRKDAPIVICNHITFLEPFMMMVSFAPSPVGAREHLMYPIVGVVIKALEAITVDRTDPDSRKKVSQAIIDRANNTAWSQTLIFPEATCTNGSGLVQFKVGAFSTGQPVQPCIVRYFCDRFNPCWVTAGPNIAVIALRVLCEPANFMSMEYLPVYNPSEEEKKDIKLFARNVRALMANALGVPATEHSYEDVLLQNEAAKNHLLPPEMAVLEIDKVSRTLHIGLDDCKNLLKKFHDIDKDGVGRVTYSQFAKALGFEISNQFLRHLFEMLEDDQGYLDFRAYVLGLGILSSESEQEQENVVKLAFRMFDVKEKGTIPVYELLKMFRKYLTNVSEMEEKDAFSVLEGKEDIDYESFKKFALKDPRYISIFKSALIPAKPLK